LPALSLIRELEQALNNGSSDKRVELLRRLTGLFLNEADRLSEQQVALFDDVLRQLTEHVEHKALAAISSVLAPLSNAPPELVLRLANNDDIVVAQPVLTRSRRLTEGDLIQIAKSKGQGHLLAISQRDFITPPVTDVLVERGNQRVFHTLAANGGAHFSAFGFETVLKRAEQDGALAERVGLRLDLPPNLLQQLLERATGTVRTRLLASAPPERKQQIEQLLAGVAESVTQEAVGSRDFSFSETLVQQLNRSGKLNETLLCEFVRAGKYEEMTSTLALFCGAPVEFIERLLKNVRPDGLIVACKSVKLSWPTVREILKMRFSHHSLSDQEAEDAKTDFISLSQAAAQRTLRFMLVQENAKLTG